MLKTYKVLSDPKLYIESFLKIKTKESRVENFRLNSAQLRLYQLITKQKKEGKPVRIIILKARQMGFSTLTEGLIYHSTATRRPKLKIENTKHWEGYRAINTHHW